jgi:hypothetical protein
LRAYLGCPNHPKGTCSQAGWVPAALAKEQLLGLVGQILIGWPGWLAQAAEEMRRAVDHAGAELRTIVASRKAQLSDAERQSERLVDLLANPPTEGPSDIPAIRRRLGELEHKIQALRDGLDAACRAVETSVALPDDAWMRQQLTALPALLAEDRRRAAILLRRLLGKVTAEVIVAPVKKRGFARLHIRIDALAMLREVLGDRLPSVLLEVLPELNGAVHSVHLDVGGPTRFDRLAPEVVAMRRQGVPWKEIRRRTGLSLGNAYAIWKRWTEAQRNADRDAG